MRAFLLSCAFVAAAFSASAKEKCDGLLPTNAQDITESFKGAIEGKITGIVGRIAGGAASINGEYQNLTADTLKNYPESHKAYVWQRIIYLACISPESNIDINRLFELFLNGPKEEVNQSSSAIEGLFPSVRLSHQGKQIIPGNLEVVLTVDNQSKVPIEIVRFFTGLYFHPVEPDGARRYGQLEGADYLGDDGLENQTITEGGQRNIHLRYRLSPTVLRQLDSNEYIYLYSEIHIRPRLSEYQRSAIPEELEYRLSRSEWLRWNVPLVSENKSRLRGAF